MRLVWAALLAAFTFGLFTTLIAQDPPPIWAGVYTAAQAERGRSVVAAHCGECHHEDLSGGEGPALVGSSFMVKWEMQSVERLFHKIRDTMPEAGSTRCDGRREARHGGVHPSTERISSWRCGTERCARARSPQSGYFLEAVRALHARAHWFRRSVACRRTAAAVGSLPGARIPR